MHLFHSRRPPRQRCQQYHRYPERRLRLLFPDYPGCRGSQLDLSRRHSQQYHLCPQFRGFRGCRVRPYLRLTPPERRTVM